MPQRIEFVQWPRSIPFLGFPTLRRVSHLGNGEQKTKTSRNFACAFTGFSKSASLLMIRISGLLKFSASRQENAFACYRNGATVHAHIRNSVITDRRRESPWLWRASSVAQRTAMAFDTTTSRTYLASRPHWSKLLQASSTGCGAGTSCKKTRLAMTMTPNANLTCCRLCCCDCAEWVCG
jgi:hypothetical protein